MILISYGQGHINALFPFSFCPHKMQMCVRNLLGQQNAVVPFHFCQFAYRRAIVHYFNTCRSHFLPAPLLLPLPPPPLYAAKYYISPFSIIILFFWFQCGRVLLSSSFLWLNTCILSIRTYRKMWFVCILHMRLYVSTCMDSKCYVSNRVERCKKKKKLPWMQAWHMVRMYTCGKHYLHTNVSFNFLSPRHAFDRLTIENLSLHRRNPGFHFLCFPMSRRSKVESYWCWCNVYINIGPTILQSNQNKRLISELYSFLLVFF